MGIHDALGARHEKRLARPLPRGPTARSWPCNPIGRKIAPWPDGVRLSEYGSERGKGKTPGVPLAWTVRVRIFRGTFLAPRIADAPFWTDPNQRLATLTADFLNFGILILTG